MDLSKINPILGYEMYTNSDRASIARRSAYGVEITMMGNIKDNAKKQNK
jgi:hypothetical protein